MALLLALAGGPSVVLTFTGIGTKSLSGVSSLAAALSSTGAGSAQRAGSVSVSTALSMTGTGPRSLAGMSFLAAAFSATGIGSPQRVGNQSVSAALSMTSPGPISLAGCSSLAATFASTGIGSGVEIGISTVTLGVDVFLTGIGSSANPGNVSVSLVPLPPPPFVPGLQTPNYDGPGGHEKRGARYKEPVEAKPFPMDKQRQPVSGFKPKRMGFKARRTKPPFRPMS